MTESTATDEELSRDPWVGLVLGGRYRLVAAIGAGGMGVVYRAWDLAADGYVVVKMPKRELLGEPKFLQRFEQELSALRSLSHPAVVPVIDVGNEQGTPFAIMPYLAGGSLKQRRLITQDGQAAPEPTANLWHWLPAVASAIDFVHASGYVHRDVKPDNILFDGPGRPFVSDFGVAKIVLQAEDETSNRGLTGTGMALGTPAYMAPELVSGSKPSPQIDQYALAVTIYELLAARKPFDGPTPAAVILAHVTGNAAALASIVPGIPATLSDAVARGMARDPANRFDSCAEFASAVLAGVPRPSAVDKLQLMCPQCSRLLIVKPDWAGKQGNCPRCKSAMAIGADLRSLWLQGDRLGVAPAGDTMPVRVLGPTPSRPVSIPKPRTQAESESVIGILKEQFLGSSVLKACAVAALCAVLVTVGFATRGRLLRNRETIANTDATGSAERGPNPERPDESGAMVTQQPLDQGKQDFQPAPEAAPTPIVQEPPESTPTQAAVVERPSVAPTRVLNRQQSVQPMQQAAAEGGEPTSPPEVKPDAVTLPEVAERPSRPDPRRPLPRSGLPVPSDDDVKKVIATFREAYDDQYTTAKETGRYQAITSRLESVIEETQDPTQRFGLLVEAEELGVRARDLGRAMEFLDKRIETYDVDAVRLRLALIKTFSGLKKAQPTQQLFDDSLMVASQAVDRDDFEVAQAAGQLASATAKSLDRVEKAKYGKQRPARGAAVPAGRNLVKDAAEVLSAIRSAEKLFGAYRAATERLAGDPDAAEANGVVGRYLCFTRREWSKGLPSLAKGPNAELCKLAQRELAVKDDADVSDALDTAGAWWDFMESKPTDLTAMELAAIKDHAARQYAALLGTITDPTNRALAEKRSAAARVREQAPASSLAALLDADADGTPIPMAGKSDSPIFDLVPELRQFRGLSNELYPLLPTAEEIGVINKHLTLPESTVYQAVSTITGRIQQQFPADRWSDVDVKFIIMMHDAIQLRRGRDGYIREWECAGFAEQWLLGSPDDLEFVRRARTIPPSILDDLNNRISMSNIKDWLLKHPAKFPTDAAKAAALDRILQSGFQFRGITEFLDALRQQQQQQ